MSNKADALQRYAQLSVGCKNTLGIDLYSQLVLIKFLHTVTFFYLVTDF